MVLRCALSKHLGRTSLLERILLAPLLLLLVPQRGALAELFEYPAHDAQKQHCHRDRDGLGHAGRESLVGRELTGPCRARLGRSEEGRAHGKLRARQHNTG